MLRLFIALMVLHVPMDVFAQSKDITIDGDHGKLAAILQVPDGKERYPLVIMCHGFAANKEHLLLTNLANSLEAKGVASIRFDFNGHGKSEGDFQDMTIINEISDAKKVFDYARALPHVMSISFVGHSQGGVVASMIAGELGAGKVKSIVLMAPAAVLRDDALRGSLFGAKFDPLNPPEYIEIKNNGSRRIGHDYISTVQTLPIYETAERFTGHALMIHGTGDTAVPYTCSLSYKKIFRRGELTLLDRADHSFHGEENRVAGIAADFFVRH